MFVKWIPLVVVCLLTVLSGCGKSRQPEKAYKQLMQRGTPARVHIASIIASETGLKYLRSKLPESTRYWIGAIDSELTAHAYIVPGLGDAGDLAFGKKE